jgi:oligosaccharide repeat unit polymerase
MLYLLAISILVLSIVGIIMTKLRDLLEPALGIILMHVLFFVIRPLSVSSGIPAFYPIHEPEVILMTFIGILSLSGFYAGYFANFPRLIAKRLPFVTHTKRNSLTAIFFLYILAGLTGALYVFHQIGIQKILHSPIQLAYAMKVGGGYLGLMIGMVKIALWLFCALTLFSCARTKSLLHYGSLFLLLFFVIGLTLLEGLRGEVFRVVGVLLVLWFYSRVQRVQLNWLVILLPLLFFAGWLILVPLNLFRHFGVVEWSIATNASWVWGQLQSFLQPFDWGAYLVQKINNGDLKPFLFSPYLNLLIAFVPRRLWPGKPVISIEYLLTERFVGDPSVVPTLTMTLPGELHLELPFAGVIIGMAFLGMVLRALYEYRLLHSNNWLANFLFANIYIATLKSFYTSFQTWVMEIIVFIALITPVVITGTKLKTARRKRGRNENCNY